MVVLAVIVGFALGAVAAWLLARSRAQVQVARLETALEHQREVAGDAAVRAVPRLRGAGAPAPPRLVRAARQADQGVARARRRTGQDARAVASRRPRRPDDAPARSVTDDGVAGERAPEAVGAWRLG